MPTAEFSARVRRLERSLPALAEELRWAHEYIDSDAASSLTKSRIVLEKVVLELYAAEMGREPRKPLLGEILADHQFTRQIERRIVSRMNAIRDLGNLGPHGAAVESSDATRVLEDLCEVLEWCESRSADGQRAEASDHLTTKAIAIRARRGGSRPWRRTAIIVSIVAALGLLAWAGWLLNERQQPGLFPVPGQPGRWYEVDSPERLDPSELIEPTT